jgi:hypothetical protein
MGETPTLTGRGSGPRPGPRPGPGEERLKRAVRLLRGLRGKPRRDDPIPYDDSWGWWIQERVATCERKVNLILTLATTAVLGELVRIVLSVFGVID